MNESGGWTTQGPASDEPGVVECACAITIR